MLNFLDTFRMGITIIPKKIGYPTGGGGLWDVRES